MIPKIVYYSPGDRAQKVIPGGAKTNESFWKSQNNIKKSILRFPTFLFTIDLVIERKKLSLETRKKTKASESLKMTSKNQVYVSHHFLFTIALVIERKKLSPEARKKTRASENLKITSQNRFYVSQHFCLL